MKRNRENGATYACYLVIALLAVCNLQLMHSVSAHKGDRNPSTIEAPTIFASSVSVEQNVPISQQKSAEIHVSEDTKSQAMEQKQRYFDVPLPHDFQDYIFLECTTNGVPEDLVIALIGVESQYNSKCISKTNDYGLMQINICHKESLERDLQVTDLLDSKQNIKAGVHMLSWIVDKYPDLDKTLMVYNHGETGAKKLWKRGIFQTQYTKKIQTQIKNLARCKE